jgi:hypothetical protein
MKFNQGSSGQAGDCYYLFFSDGHIIGSYKSDKIFVLLISTKEFAMNEVNHIEIVRQEDFPKEIVREFIDSISKDGLIVKHISRPIGIYASLDWVLPTIFIVYLSKSYFDSFLKEAGKDHYQILKSGFMQLFKKLFGEKPESRPSRRSILFSVQARAIEFETIKFIFPEGVTIEEYLEILDSLFDLLSDHYEKYPSDELYGVIHSSVQYSKSIYLEYSHTEKCWKLIDAVVEAQKIHKAQKKQDKPKD